MLPFIVLRLSTQSGLSGAVTVFVAQQPAADHAAAALQIGSV